MNGDMIVGLVAIAAMLILVVPRFLQRGVAKGRMLQLALLWVAIFVIATFVAIVASRF
ncbi:hypothetical protein [Rhizorhabdus sp. FW153]|uniref:hypothetical protein n=1 Tax=Rhizorhabdus sp. FW153 TaxID=3400216 RepID=UPI003CF6921D